nr:MFS transporter [Candidatus Sigynarchaeota archaeon]
MKEQDFEEHLPVKYKLGYSSARLGNDIMSGIGFAALTFFYNDVLDLRADLAGWAWMIFAIWNALNDPLFGIIEDKTRTSIGRRIPYLRYGSPLYVLVFLLCWFPLTDNTNQIGLFFNFLLVLFALDTMFTITGLITYSLPAEMTLTQKARANIIMWGTLFGVVGTIISYVLPVFLLTESSPGAVSALFQPMMFIISIACGVMIFVGSFFIKENDYTRREEPLGFLQSVVETAKNKPFLIFEVSKVCMTIMSTTITTSLTYYVKYVLELGGGIMSALPIGSVFLVAVVFVIIYNVLIPRRGAKKILIFGLIWAGGAFILLFFTGMNLVTAIVSFCILGVGFSATLIAAPVLFSDTIDHDEIRTGKRRETTYSGMEALITKPAISVANWLFLLVINAFGYSSTTTVPAPIEVKTGILFAICIVSAIFVLIAAAVLCFYPLDGPNWKEQKQKLQIIHDQKEREFLASIGKDLKR